MGVSSQWDQGILMQASARCLCDMPRYMCACVHCVVHTYISLSDAHSVAYCVCPWNYVKFYMTCNKLDDTYSDKMHPDKEL